MINSFYNYISSAVNVFEQKTSSKNSHITTVNSAKIWNACIPSIQKSWGILKEGFFITLPSKEKSNTSLQNDSLKKSWKEFAAEGVKVTTTGLKNVGQNCVDHPYLIFVIALILTPQILSFAAACNNLTKDKTVVAIIDDDFQVDHQFLHNKWNINPQEIPRDLIDNDADGFIDNQLGYHFAQKMGIDEKWPTPPNSQPHGTSLSIIVSNATAPVKLIPIGMGPFNTPEEISQFSTITANAIRYAISSNPDAVLMCSTLINSLRVDSPMFSVLHSHQENGTLAPIMKQLTFSLYQNQLDLIKNSATLFIMSAGNNGVDLDVNITYPSSFSFPNMIVATEVNEDGSLASGSNYGSTVQVGVRNRAPVYVSAKESSISAPLRRFFRTSRGRTSAAAAELMNTFVKVKYEFQGKELSPENFLKIVKQTGERPKKEHKGKYGVILNPEAAIQKARCLNKSNKLC